eukprot:441818-Prymnesium_polylepis.1
MWRGVGQGRIARTRRQGVLAQRVPRLALPHRHAAVSPAIRNAPSRLRASKAASCPCVCRRDRVGIIRKCVRFSLHLVYPLFTLCAPPSQAPLGVHAQEGCTWGIPLGYDRRAFQKFSLLSVGRIRITQRG